MRSEIVSALFLIVLLAAPALSDLSQDQNNRTIQAHRDHRRREREKRKNQIRDFISRSFNWNGKPMPTGEEVRERISSLPEVDLPLDTTTTAPDPLTLHYTERVQSFFPICDPQYELLTQLPDIPNIAPQFFRVKFPTRRQDTQISVNAAKLRLYKLGSDGLTGKKIRITVSQLKLESPGIRPANKVVMLDSKMVDTTEAGWISLDVTGAVKIWHNHPHRPMALMLQVEDDKRRSLLPNSYFQPLSCDAGPTTSQPAPLINGENILGSLNKNNQPLIDISTLETPGGQVDIPQSVMIWGLPQKTRLDDDTAGAVQDVEIRHIPAPERSQEEEEEEDGLTSSTSQAGDNSSSGELQTLEEVDYLDPMFGSSPSQDQGNTNRYGLRWTKPVATKIIMTSDQLEETLRGLGDTVDQVRDQEDSLEDRVNTLYDRQITETEFYKKLYLSMMTKADQKKVIRDE